jgi:hypothetical protein
MKCWTIRFYFRKQGFGKRLLQGQVCGCIGGETKEAAISSVSPFEMDEGCTLVKVTATPSRKGHFCFTRMEAA